MGAEGVRGQGRWETMGRNLLPEVWGSGKASWQAGVTGEGAWLPRAGEPRASGSIPSIHVMG